MHVFSGARLSLYPSSLKQKGSWEGGHLAGSGSVISMNSVLCAKATWTPMSFSAFGPIPGLVRSLRAHCCSLGLKSLKETMPVSWHLVPSRPLTPEPWFIRL